VQDYNRITTPAYEREGNGRLGGFREGGIYQTPDGSEVIAGVPCGGGRCFLYLPLVWAGRSWIIGMPVAYEITPEGSIITGKGAATGWRGEQLSDTGRTARGR
jgi:hypothetical protein